MTSSAASRARCSTRRATTSGRTAGRRTAASADPTEILALMREVFWSKPESLGRVRLPLVRESDEMPAFAEFAENARWTYGGATFATLNLAGTHNNQELRVEKYWREFVRREQANLAWVKATFAAARRAGQRAVVLAFHSNPFDKALRYDGGPVRVRRRGDRQRGRSFRRAGARRPGPLPRIHDRSAADPARLRHVPASRIRTSRACRSTAGPT